MSDVIPQALADLLRDWHFTSHGERNAVEDRLFAWVDENLPPDLGPVTPDTPWGSLCRNGERELLFIGRSATASTEWVAQEPSSWFTYSAPFTGEWRVVRSGPAEPQSEREDQP